MYAIFQSGNKQYRVSKGQIVRLDKLNIEVGNTIDFTKVLIIASGEEIKVGIPFVEGSVIKAEVLAHSRGKKIKVIKFHRRKHYRKQQGHRQWFTDVKIVSMSI